jgi:maltose O-acetyltransferase
MSIFNKIARRFIGRRPSIEDTISFLRKEGAEIGKRLNVYGGSLRIDTSFPFMLHIGDDVEITANVNILNHDYSWSVIKAYTGQLLGGVGPVYIGNNVFIGSGATILMNTHIGDNCIIGAKSVVSGSFPDNSVIAGCPARVICTLEEYIKKREDKQLEEAIAIVNHYRKAFGRNPSKDKLPAYFWLFEPRNNKIETPVFLQRMHLKNNYELSMKLFKETPPLFDSFESFLNSIPFEQ